MIDSLLCRLLRTSSALPEPALYIFILYLSLSYAGHGKPPCSPSAAYGTSTSPEQVSALKYPIPATRQKIAQHIRIVIHPVSIQITSSLTEILICDLYKILAGIYIAVVIIASALIIGKLVIVHGVSFPASDVRAESKDDHIRLSKDRRHISLPLFIIRLQILGGAYPWRSYVPRYGWQIPSRWLS